MQAEQRGGFNDNPFLSTFANRRTGNLSVAQSRSTTKENVGVSFGQARHQLI